MSGCRKPFSNAFGAHGCGQCLPCRINKRRALVNRLMCESYFHENISFVTLTVDSDKCQTVRGADTMDIFLNKPYVQKWLNRFRMRVAPTRIRYFLVGEYGSDHSRPHYHAILFGYPKCPYGGSKPIVYRQQNRQCPCDVCRPVLQSWRLGNVTLDSFTMDSAAYVAGYVVDKINEKKGFESWRLSSDGLGVGIVAPIIQNPDVIRVGSQFSTLSHGGKTLPMGKYLKGKIRNALLQKLPEEIQNSEEAFRLGTLIVDKMRMRNEEYKKIRKEALKNGNLTPFEICKYELDKKNQAYLNKLARNKTYKKEKI